MVGPTPHRFRVESVLQLHEAYLSTYRIYHSVVDAGMAIHEIVFSSKRHCKGLMYDGLGALVFYPELRVVYGKNAKVIGRGAQARVP